MLSTGFTFTLATTLVGHTTYPGDEAIHDVHFWNARGLKVTSSLGGLCYVLTSPQRDYTGCRLRADGAWFVGDQIPAWGSEHLPQSIAIAEAVRRARQPDQRGGPTR